MLIKEELRPDYTLGASCLLGIIYMLRRILVRVYSCKQQQYTNTFNI